MADPEDVPRATPWWRTKVLDAPIDHPGWALFAVIIMAGAGLLLREMAKVQMKVSEEVPHELKGAPE